MVLSDNYFVKTDGVIFVKQKTAYEMRMSDWSSDVCSSDLAHAGQGSARFIRAGEGPARQDICGQSPSRLSLAGIQERAPACAFAPSFFCHEGLLMSAYKDPSFQERTALARQARQKALDQLRSEERRVGKEGVSTGR